MKTRCLYCGNPIERRSADHIFPAFLGGRATIWCCKSCNDTFGHTFEAKAAIELQRLQTSISTWGLQFTGHSRPWRKALSIGGKFYDLLEGINGVKIRLSYPAISRDDNSFLGEYPSHELAENAAASIAKKWGVQKPNVEFCPVPHNQLLGLETSLNISREMKLVALKMCIALSKYLPEYDLGQADFSQVFHQYRSETSTTVKLAPLIYEGIDRSRTPLSHVIYLERGGDRVYGIVQFFGVLQLYIDLGCPSPVDRATAVLATLDPILGKEKIKIVEPLNVQRPPDFYQLSEFAEYMNSWMEKFRTEAIARGATHPPSLAIKQIRFGSP